MKTAAIIAVLCGSTGVLGARYNSGGDPCQALKKKDCLDENACHYQVGERKYWLSRKDSPTHHHEEAGKQSCQMIHMKDRTRLSKKDKQESLVKFGVHGEWDDMECAEAFYMKDCKDLNQNGASNDPKCAWNYITGCSNYDGETRVYDTGPVPSASDIYIDLYEEGDKYLGYTLAKNTYCHKADYPDGPQETGGASDGPPPEMIDTCVGMCTDAHNGVIESDSFGSIDACTEFALEDMVVVISLQSSSAEQDECFCFPPVGFESSPQAGFVDDDCSPGKNAYIHPDNTQKDTYLTSAATADCETADYKDREYQN